MSDCRKNDIASVLKTAEAHNAEITGKLEVRRAFEALAIDSEKITNEMLKQLEKVVTEKMRDMSMNEYQKLAQVTVVYPPDMKIIYPLIGLCGETGEVAEKIKKWIRDNNRETMSPETLDLLKKELGDVLWYLAVLARDLGLSLDEIAKDNIQKLHDRKERGMVHGKGDVR